MYGVWRREGLLAYAIGFSASMPFFVVPGVFTGPVAAAMSGVDIGWLVGLVVTAIAYAVLTRNFEPATEAAACAASRLTLGE
jgi:purine-cytosine permease-like protein